MKKRILSLISALLVLVMLASLLASCGDGAEGTDGNDTTHPAQNAGGEQTGNEDDVLPVILSLVASGSSDYKIIVPEESGEKLLGAMHNLRAALEDYTGAKLTYDRDTLMRGETADPNAKEILIGATNRPESAQEAEGLKVSEYKISAVGNKLVMVGFGEVESISAVNYFVDKFIKSNSTLKYGLKDGSLTFTNAENYHRLSEYYIKSIKLNGTDLFKAQIVIPKGGTIENFYAIQLNKHLGTYYGQILPIVTDETAKGACEVRIGLTNRSQTKLEKDECKISVGADYIEIAAGSFYAFPAVGDSMRYDIFKSTMADIELKDGDSWTPKATLSSNLEAKGDLRIIYHNVWGYLNADGSNPVANRAQMGIEVYKQYDADILCFQEFASTYRNEATVWLNAHYKEICYSSQGGTGNPIFYDDDRFDVLAQGYEKARNGDKGTTWAVFKDTTTGKIFGVTNSHFAANTNAGDDPVIGNEYRVQDAKAALSAVEKIKATEGVPSDVVVFTGGDFNAAKGSDPINTVMGGTAITGTLQNTRDLSKIECTISAHHDAYTYDETYGIYNLPLETSTPADSAIDYIMVSGGISGIEVERYDIIKDRLTSSVSDHCPQLLDIAFK